LGVIFFSEFMLYFSPSCVIIFSECCYISLRLNMRNYLTGGSLSSTTNYPNDSSNNFLKVFLRIKMYFSAIKCHFVRKKCNLKGKSFKSNQKHLGRTQTVIYFSEFFLNKLLTVIFFSEFTCIY